MMWMPDEHGGCPSIAIHDGMNLYGEFASIEILLGIPS
jgi:hypothetical protein